MISFQKTFLGLGLALGATAAVGFADDTVFLEVGPGFGESNPYQAGDGGEFTALLQNNGVPVPVSDEYSPLATYTVNGVTGFETFCVQDQVYFYVGSTYDYVISPYLIDPASPDINTPVGDFQVPLSVGTAWLYQQFSNGILAGYDYLNTDPANTRLTDAGELQNLIWGLDPHNGDAPPTPSTPFANLLIAKFGSLAAAEVAETPDEFGVNVLDLVTYNSAGQINGIYQDQLIYTGGLPDGASTFALLGTSALLLAITRRRLAVRA
jgi:hypothetical protein